MEFDFAVLKKSDGTKCGAAKRADTGQSLGGALGAVAIRSVSVVELNKMRSSRVISFKSIEGVTSAEVFVPNVRLSKRLNYEIKGFQRNFILEESETGASRGGEAHRVVQVSVPTVRLSKR